MGNIYIYKMLNKAGYKPVLYSMSPSLLLVLFFGDESTGSS